MTITRTSLLAATTLVLALGAGACGTSDEDEIRATATEWIKLSGKKDAKRACELMTPRAQVQVTGFLGSFGGGGSCVKVLASSESNDDQLSARDVEKAKVAIRDDLALLTAPGSDAQQIGLRKVDGDWRLDNIINPTLTDRPRRIDPRLSKGTDEQQLRATHKAVGEAFADKDYKRGCELFSYGAEAQLIVGRLFASFGDTEEPKTRPDLSCAASLRALSKLGDGDDDDLGFSGEVPSAGRLAAADVSIRGTRATVRVAGEEPVEYLREEGHWLVAPDTGSITTEKAPSAASLERCWRRAGAVIASSARELRFAVGDTARHIAISPGRVSVKAKDWRIFYTLPADGEDPGLGTVLAKPSTVRTVAYVKDAPAHAGIVARARACGR